MAYTYPPGYQFSTDTSTVPVVQTSLSVTVQPPLISSAEAPSNTPTPASSNTLAIDPSSAAVVPSSSSSSSSLLSEAALKEHQQQQDEEEKKKRKKNKEEKGHAKLLALCTMHNIRHQVFSDFRKKISEVVVNALSPYMKQKRIASREDFKHLSRKLTHIILEKEIKKAVAKDEQLAMRDSIPGNVRLFVASAFQKIEGVYSVANSKSIIKGMKDQ